MDQNQTVDNDLQKAIDDITQNTNIDPVFSDPIAAPSSVPEGDTGELGEPVGPFPEPEPEVPAMPEMTESALAPEPVMASEPAMAPQMPADYSYAPAPAPAPEYYAPAPAGLSARQIKEAALRDLMPLMDRLHIPAARKFDICRDFFENFHDVSVLEPAYRAALEIQDDSKRAESLLYLVEAIDRM